MDDAIPLPTGYDTVCGKLSLTSGYEKHKAIFPPKVESVHVLGNVVDPAKGAHPRTVGRSSMLAGIPYYVFGQVASVSNDGYAFGAVPNAVSRALEPLTDPLLTTYVSVELNGFIHPFLGLTENEVKFEHETGLKVIISIQGGICEGKLGSGKGCVWFQKLIREKKDGITIRSYYQGTGVAPVKVDGVTGELLNKRVCGETLLFKRHEPAFGTFCSAVDNQWYYLWGRYCADIYLARVSLLHPFEREYYQFWNGYSFTGDITMISPVLTGYAHGTIYKTKLFGHTYEWAFVGSTDWEDCAVMMGAAKDPQGPFEITQIASGEKLHESGTFADCVYAHPWALKESLGEVLVSWREKWPGGIIGAKFQFQMLHQGAFWKDISLEDLQTCISTLAKTRSELADIASEHDVFYELDSKGFGKASIRLLGGSANTVDDAALAICKQIGVWARQAMGIENEETKKSFKNAFGLIGKRKNKENKE
ncbi:hypothetical protein GX50_04973 [[Emmonsia] crescens]|uniref:Uncharacterized protein n=1 Tax=[Emmonsia] crescens TaxID=73230 RepID=A0A2B7ZGV1_9EURO|nr:hypothetical protein GX50_04973 [Emmonsia crescens]